MTVVDAYTIPAELEIPSMPRFDFYAFLGLVRVMEPETELLMRRRAQRLLEEDDYDSPHSRPWFVSFHGSEMPEPPQDACSRYLAYRMMNFAAGEAMPPWVTTTGTIGKAGELDIADAWFAGGRMLAIPESANDHAERLAEVAQLMRAERFEAAIELAEKPGYHQLGFVDHDHWMTVSTDLPILPKGWRRPHIVEVKCKADDVLDEMIEGRLIQFPDGRIQKIGREPDKRHAVQLKATIGKAHDFDWGNVTVCSACWGVLFADIFELLTWNGQIGEHRNPAISYQRMVDDNLRNCPFCGVEAPWETFKLGQPTTGEVYYWSRSWPRKTKSFYYEHDESFMRRGLEVLARTREDYINDVIPERPEHFQWSVGPCQNCNFRSFCRLDSGLPPRARKVRPEMVRTKLTESAGVEHTQALRPRYDPDAVRARVFQEWGHE